MSKISVSESRRNSTKLPPEQEAIPEKYSHPGGNIVEFAKADVGTSIPERFEKIVRIYPERLAVKDKERSLTYDQFNRAANRIARAILANRGEGSEPIAILFEHGIDGIVAIFGVLKAGKFYVALDRSVPLEKNDVILRDSGARLIVTNNENARLAQELSGDARTLINIDKFDNSFSSVNLYLPIDADSLANILYTSGSTGKPKGVVSTHRNVLDSLVVLTNDLRLTVDDRSILLHSVSFGLSLTVLFPSLLNGASLFPFDSKSEGIPRLVGWLIKEQITVWHSSPALFRQFASSVSGQEHLHGLRLINLAGAPRTQLDFDLFKNNFSRQTLLRVSMGSTEARAISSAILDHSFLFPRDGAPVGYPVKGKTVLLFDENGNEVGLGQVGEIAVKGRNLNQGYWNQLDLTGAKFLPDPTGGDERIFLTGDLGRMLPDGFLICLGRKDNQVKIRGYRIEIAEIENTLLAHPGVKDLAIVACDRDSDHKYLVAYIVPHQSSALRVNDLRALLKEKLPDYMIPAVFIFLESLPLTNGKLDRNALPLPDHSRPDMSQPYIAARSEAEQELVRIWQEVLDTCPVGIHDNFFDLGGNSLVASRIMSRVIKKFQLELPIQSLFQSPTVAAMAALITEQQARKLENSEMERILEELEAMSDEEAQRCVTKSNSTISKP